MTTVVSGAQIAAARALTGVSQAKLAQRAGLEIGMGRDRGLSR